MDFDPVVQAMAHVFETAACNTPRDANFMQAKLRHSLRVAKWCQRLIVEGAPTAHPDIVVVAGFLHDVGFCCAGNAQHCQQGAPIAVAILGELNYAPQDIAMVSDMILLHDNIHDAAESLTPETCILMDADRLDAHGAFTLLRPMRLGGEMDDPLVLRALQTAYGNACAALDTMKTPQGKRMMTIKLNTIGMFVEELEGSMVM